MNRKGAVLLPILIVLIIISFALAAGAFYLYQREHAHNIQLQGQIADLENSKRLTEGKLEDSKKMASELQLKLQEIKANISSLTEEFSKEKTAHADALNQLEQFKSDLQQQKSLRQDLENKLKEAQDEGKKIKEQLKVIEKQKTELEEKIKSLQSDEDSVELGTVVVNNEPVVTVDNPPLDKNAPVKAVKKSSSKAKLLEGRIMVVNREFNFVVINLGSKDGVAVGDIFLVSHEGKNLGEIKIEKVHDSMSAAGFALELKDQIKENDQIIQKAK
ncbi:MAG: hypothetical protein PHR84_05035 [Candidatus Omnitrophica bacterium]|jgi:myosin heavy subunit|nr:hypothetical protein [Candidatus Omnitrophota bacterium]MDD5660961.1 hypothetical protein [Candidatus Omnitrophota bacterium]